MERDPKKWSNTAKAGAAVGSAAVFAALLFAGRQATRKKIDPESPNPDPVTAPPPAPDGDQYESD